MNETNNGEPKLPSWLMPRNVIKVSHGNWTFYYVRDGRYDLCFKWDGLSHLFNGVEVKLRMPDESLPQGE